METILARFPHLGKIVFNNLDNQSLINLKEASRDVSEFMENDRFFWIRILKRYRKNFDKFKESWKEVTKKTPLEKVKQLVMTVKTFFRAYPLIEKFKSNQIAPIHISTEQNNIEVCKFINEKTTNKNPEATLHLAITCDNKIEMPTDCLQTFTVLGLTPLHIAAIKGNLDLFNLIFVNSLGKNPANERTKLTPLHMAAQNGHFEICKLIIENVDNKNPLGKDQTTPFHNAAANGHLEICKLMIKNNVDIDYRYAYHETPLHLAARKEHLEICRIIIEDMKEKTPVLNQDFIQWWELIQSYEIPFEWGE